MHASNTPTDRQNKQQQQQQQDEQQQQQQHGRVGVYEVVCGVYMQLSVWMHLHASVHAGNCLFAVSAGFAASRFEGAAGAAAAAACLCSLSSRR